MTSVFVLRLISSALADGRVVGEVECVDTGRVQVVRTLEELGDHLRAGSAVDLDPSADIATSGD